MNSNKQNDHSRPGFIEERWFDYRNLASWTDPYEMMREIIKEEIVKEILDNIR